MSEEHVTPDSGPEPTPPSMLSLLPRTATGALIAANLALFVYITFTFGWDATDRDAVLFAFGAKWNPSIARGEYYRVICSTFLHSGIVHILVNMQALMNLGLAIEFLMGTPWFLGIYCASGIAGQVAGYLGHDHLSIGASGAICGLGGAATALGFLGRNRLKPEIAAQLRRGVLPFVVITALMGWQIKGIDNHAHAGGFVAGALVTSFALLIVRWLRAFHVIGWTLALAALGLFGYAGKEMVAHYPAGRVAIDVSDIYLQAIVPADKVRGDNVKALLAVIAPTGPRSVPNRARGIAARNAAVEILDAHKALSASLAALPGYANPELRVAVANMKAQLKPLDALRNRIARYSDATAEQDIAADAAAHQDEWMGLYIFKLKPMLEPINALWEKYYPRPDSVRRP